MKIRQNMEQQITMRTLVLSISGKLSTTSHMNISNYIGFNTYIEIFKIGREMFAVLNIEGAAAFKTSPIAEVQLTSEGLYMATRSSIYSFSLT